MQALAKESRKWTQVFNLRLHATLFGRGLTIVRVLLVYLSVDCK